MPRPCPALTMLFFSNQMGKTHSKPLASRHGRGTAWARHAMCESAFIVLVSVTLEVIFLYNAELSGIRDRIYINMSLRNIIYITLKQMLEKSSFNFQAC
jgi:hypothetical protein